MKSIRHTWFLPLIVGISLAEEEAARLKQDTSSSSTHEITVENSERPAILLLMKTIARLEVESFPQHLSFWGFNEDVAVQGELLKEFQKRYPGLLADALRSAGNMHNPKVLPLRAKFSECLLRTPTVKIINELLRAKGYSVSRATIEKFEVNKEKDTPSFHAIVWLHVEQLSQTPSEAEH